MRISVIDSGMGGVAFANNLKREITDLKLSLLIDHEGFHYGDKDILWLKERLEYLINKANTNVIVIACNTLSSLIFHYKLQFKKAIVDVITPTIYFIKEHKYTKIAIIATKNTIHLNIYRRLLNNIDIVYIDGTYLINDIEYKNDIQNSLEEVVTLIPKDCDGVLLGCTHLIEIKNEFRSKLNVDVISQDEIFALCYKHEF